MSGQPDQLSMMRGQTQYYEAHCSGCGEVTTADRLAFDFGALINIAVEKASTRELGSNDKWLPLLKMDLGYYLTWRDLEQEYGLRTNQMRRFAFTVSKLRALLEVKAEASFGELASTTTTDSIVYNHLSRSIHTPMEKGKRATRTDTDIQTHAQNIMMVVGLCTQQQSPDPDEVIAEFDVSVQLARDDRGNEFAKQLQVLYEDGERAAVINNVCPRCGKSFYSEVGKHQEIIICMAGTARVGKTAFLAALVDSILNDDDDYLTIMPSIDPEWRFFNERILKAYQNGEKIDKTAFEGDGETIPLFSLEIEIRHRSYIFTFVDMPGEAFDSIDQKGHSFILNDRKIVKSASMIWLCIDPQQISASVAAYAKMASADEDKVNTDVMEVMNNISRTLEAVCDGVPSKNAVILITKSDMIMGGGEKLYEPDIDVVKTFVKPGEIVDVDKMNEYANRAYQYLSQARQITRQLDRMFVRYNTFAVAAIGKEPSAIPGGDGLDKWLGLEMDAFKNEPSLVELPFIWTMSALGLVPAQKMVPKYELVEKGFFKKTREEVYVGDVAADASYNDFYHPEG